MADSANINRGIQKAVGQLRAIPQELTTELKNIDSNLQRIAAAIENLNVKRPKKLTYWVNIFGEQIKTIFKKASFNDLIYSLVVLIIAIILKL